MDEAKLISTYKQVFNSEPGRIVLADMMRAAMFMTDTGVMSDAELRQTEGARNLIRRTIKFCNITSEQIDQMIYRHNAEEEWNTDV